MHRIVFALVEAATQEDALLSGKSVFEMLVDENPHGCTDFDDYGTFDEEGMNPAGSGRWSELPAAVPVESNEGSEILDEAMDVSSEVFQNDLEQVREALDELSDEEIRRDVDDVRFRFHEIGAHDGPSTFVFDEDGAGIRHCDELDHVLEQGPRDDSIWVVPADIHY